METYFGIKINNKEYQLDRRLEAFIEIGRQQGNIVPLHKLRLKDEAWFVLWDKKEDKLFEFSETQQALPLTAGWLKIMPLTQDGMKERISLIICMYEAIEALKIIESDTDLKRTELALKKSINAFLSKND